MKLLLYAIALVFLCAVFPAFAEKPPDTLLREVNQFPIVHDQYCRVTSMGLEDVDCLIYYNKAKNEIYIVIFDEELAITLIIHNDKDKKEILRWCRFDICS